jgi:predicted permease
MTPIDDPTPRLLRFLLRLLCPRERREAVEGDLLELLQTRRRRGGVIRDVLSVLAMLLLVRLRSIRPAGLVHDLSLAWRAIVRRPVFACAVIATMALGIGANTAIFSLVNAVLLRLAPVQDPKALVLLNRSSDRSGLGASFPYPFYRQLRESDTVMAGVLCQARMVPNVDAGDGPERVSGAMVSMNYFEVLGVRAHVGRVFTEGDDRRPGGDRVVVLGYRYWQRRFGGDPGVVGRSIRMNTQAMTIVGVTPPGFDGLELGGTEDVRVPITLQPYMYRSPSRLDNPNEWWLQILGRLKPGVRREQAERVLAADYARFIAPERARAGFTENYLILLDGSRGRPVLQTRFGQPLVILSILAALVLTLVCLNVANLMLARNAARQKEVSITLALGAGPGRVVQQMLVEALLLAAIGGAIGLGLSLWSARILTAIAMPSPGGPMIDVPLDGRVMLFVAAAAGASAILCALVPALVAAKTNISAALGAEGRSVVHGRMFGRKMLVSAQMALSLTILAGAGLFVRTLLNLQRLDAGFETGHVALFSLNPSLSGYDDTRVRIYYDELTAMVTGMPGVHAATLAMMPLLDVSRWGSGLKLDTGEEDNRPGPLRDAVGPGYFTIIGMPLREGRDFSAADGVGAPKVAIVNESFVRKYFPDGRALGRRIGPGGQRDPAAFTIVGVVRDSRVVHVREAPAPFWYIPYKQLGKVGELTLHVRTHADPTPILNDLRQAISSIDKGVTVFRGRTMTRQIEDQMVVERLLATLATAFGLIAAVLASIGLYGVLSFVTSARTREIALRMALGASPRSIFGLMLRQTGALIVIGLAAGLGLTLFLTRHAESVLFGIGPADAVTILSAAGLLLAFAAVATLLPVRRAARIDPMTALH